MAARRAVADRVLGAVTFGAGVYVFATWVTVELAAIVLNALRRNSRGR